MPGVLQIVPDQTKCLIRDRRIPHTQASLKWLIVHALYLQIILRFVYDLLY